MRFQDRARRVRRSVGWLLTETGETRPASARFAHDTAHGERIHGIVARNRQNALPIGHCRVLAFANDAESGLLQREWREDD